MKTNLLFINIFLLIASVSLGIFIFRSDTKSPLNKPICERCNVILISLDTLGSNHLPCYGYYRNTAENTCNFAKQNVFFTNSFSNASWTLPSHFSIFTSLYPNHHIIVNDVDHQITAGDFTNKLDPSINTMAEIFKKANYKTIYVGPLDDPTLPLQRGIERGFETISDSINQYTFVGWEKKGIDQLINNNKKNQSTFLFLHTYFVHAPYFINDATENNKIRIYSNDQHPEIPLDGDHYHKFSKEFMNYVISQYQYKIDVSNVSDRKKYQNIIDSLKSAKDIKQAEDTYYQLVSNHYIRNDFFSGFYFEQLKKTPETISYGRSLYDEMIYRLDKKLKIIFDLVSNSELADNTIIIITSDHGEAFNEHGSLNHPADHLYNVTTSVPLIMYIPGIKQKKINNMVQSIDILPTILRLTGIKNSNNNFDGIDLTDMILGRWGAKKNDYLISEGPNDSIRDNRWKLYIKNLQQENIKDTNELYDLHKDPEEKNNVAQKEPEIVKRLSDNLSKIIYKNK